MTRSTDQPERERGSDGFRERLLAADPISPTLRNKYLQELNAMFEKKLTSVQRLAYVFTGLLSIGFVILFGSLAVMVPKEFPMLGRIGFGVGAVFGLAWAVLSFRILRKGSVQLRKDPRTMAGLSWGFVVIMVTIFMMLAGRAGEKLWGVEMVVNGLVFLVFAAVFLLRSVIEDSQFKTQEKLLEIEYRLAELSEQMKK